MKHITEIVDYDVRKNVSIHVQNNVKNNIFNNVWRNVDRNVRNTVQYNIRIFVFRKVWNIHKLFSNNCLEQYKDNL